jgi:TPP-dependent pyruvate/acetoin dehydrogenase alpha subunit
MNIAAVQRVGTVFVCQNNGWAISLPTSEQTASETIAEKAIAYGMPGVRVDGNDVFAVYDATREAVARARRGEGPTLIEAVTYRMGPHTTADDPARYRSDTDRDEWAQRDPIERLRIYLSERGRWDEDWQTRIESQASIEVERAVELAESLRAPTAEEMFGAMFAEMPHHLSEQLTEAMTGA